MDAGSIQSADNEAQSTVGQASGLEAFLASGLPAPQRFVVRPGRDTLLVGQQGTQVFVPANAWDVPLAGAPVYVQLQEFYSTPDIVLAGLGTTAGTELLETGGMLKLTATSEAGTPVALRPGARLALRLPTKKVQSDMQLFRGEATDAHINWHLDSVDATQTFVFDQSQFRSNRKKKRVKHPKLREEWPEYLGGEHRQARALVRAATYPAPTLAKLRRARKLSAQERAAVFAYNDYVGREKPGKLEKIRRLAVVEFTVDTLGATTNVKLRPNYDAELAAPVLAAVQAWQLWRPAKLDRPLWAGSRLQYEHLKHKEDAIGLVRVMITTTGKILVTPPSWDVRATRDKLELRAGLERQAAYRARVEAAQVQRDVALRNGGTLPLAKPASPTESELYYELSSSGLGWVNCDRFLNSPQPLFAYGFDTKMPCEKAMLVFRDSRAMMNGTPTAAAGRITFGRVPTGAEATIVAMRWEQGQAYLAIQHTTLAARAPAPSLDYRPVNILELQKALATLN